jgi:hypothetical protein
MILKSDLVYAEFLRHFLDVIQNEESRNTASLLSGCLRSSVVSAVAKTLGNSSSYLPLSSIIKAGLVDEHGTLLSSATHEKAKKIDLFFDHDRLIASLTLLNIEDTKYNHVQLITLVTCLQEAATRVLNGPFGIIFKNVSNISNPLAQEFIMRTLKNLSIKPLIDIADKIQFTSGCLSLTADAIAVISAEEKKFMAKGNMPFPETTPEEIEVPDEELQSIIQKKENKVASSDCIQVLDELVPCLARESKTKDELLEQEAQAHLLKLKCYILSKTAADEWQVKFQLLLCGDELTSGEDTVTLPHSVSQILAIINARPIPEPLSYRNALQEIQDIVRAYKADWYIWGRNQLPLFSAASAVEELHQLVLDFSLVEPEAGSALVNEEPTPLAFFTSAVNFGLSFFTEPEPPEATRKGEETKNLAL